jgi:hypothetical protein
MLPSPAGPQLNERIDEELTREGGALPDRSIIDDLRVALRRLQLRRCPLQPIERALAGQRIA